MIDLTDSVSDDTIEVIPAKKWEVTMSCVYDVNGKVVNRMLKFFVASEEQFKQYQNTATLGVL